MTTQATRRGGVAAAPDRGSQALEFALVLPLVLVVLSVVAVTVGRVAVDRVRAEHLAGEAARAAAAYPADQVQAPILAGADSVSIAVAYDGAVVIATVEILSPLPWGSDVVVSAQAAAWREPAA